LRIKKKQFKSKILKIALQADHKRKLSPIFSTASLNNEFKGGWEILLED
jgi:hypothetical protein